MRKISLRSLFCGVLVALMLVSVFASPAFASTTVTRTRSAPLTTESWLVCGPNVSGNTSIFDQTTTGNAPECSGVTDGYLYEPLSQNTGLIGTWVGIGSYTTTCEIDVWFPYGSYSTDTQTRYDFWAGSTWLAWPGHNINQDLAPAGWNVLTKSLTVNSSSGVHVTVKDAGGSGNLAMAAMRFICNFS